MNDRQTAAALSILGGNASGPIIATDEALSFWGGIDPANGMVIDVHHPLHGVCITGSILVMPTTRGSCTGSGVLLDLILSGRAPSALVFSEAEDVLTLGALVGVELFDAQLPILRLSPEELKRVATQKTATISADCIVCDDFEIRIVQPPVGAIELTDSDRDMLEGKSGVAASQAMGIVCRMALQQGATALIDVSRGHIDGCIYASPANLTFAEKLADLGGQVRIPTTMNAISVDRINWREQGVPSSFGEPAARLADAYVRMGCKPTFTCSPYLLKDAPAAHENIAWAESNAVIFANTVLSARTAKHPDFLDLCIALTGRAPLSGVYLEAHRRPRRIIDVAVPPEPDETIWPLIGYLAGKAAPDRIPLLRGLEESQPTRDDLKALCAAFGTTSAAPMLHIAGVTPEANLPCAPDTDKVTISLQDMSSTWGKLNAGPSRIDLVAIGSPHASLRECHALAEGMDGRRKHDDVTVILTVGREVMSDAKADGTLARLEASGVQVLNDLCWCSISEPVFPKNTRIVMTNSGKYAHYGPGLSGRAIRFGALKDCVDAALTGESAARRQAWLAPDDI